MLRVRQYVFIFILVILTILMGFNYFYRPFQIEYVDTQTQEVQEAATISAKTKMQQAQEIFALLSPQERVTQLLAEHISIPFTASQAAQTKPDDSISSINPGFFVLSGKKIGYQEAQEAIASLIATKTHKGVRPLISVDHEGGDVQRLSGEGFTVLPAWQDTCLLEPDERKQLLESSAEELSQVGIDIVFGPVVDVGNNIVLGDRICSIDSYPIVADRSMDFITAFSNRGILPVIKHFPGIGLTKKDLHTSFDVITISDNDVRLYKYIIEQSPTLGVMISHVGVTNQYPDVPCSLSSSCISELKTTYPEVLVFSDALEMDAASYNRENPLKPHDLLSISKQAIVAGNDVLLLGQSVSEAELTEIVFELTKEYVNDEEFKKIVDTAVVKVLQHKL